MWFAIKRQPQSCNGSKHIFLFIERSRFLPDYLLKCISHNAYFGHSESILMTMLFDKDEKINADALSLIGSKMSQFPSNITSIRKFSLPDINFQANCYRDLIDWNQDVTIPPLIRYLWKSNVSFGALQKKLEKIGEIQCHSQAVERIVKVVTKATVSVYGHERREGYIKCTLDFQSIMSLFSTKSDWQ